MINIFNRKDAKQAQRREGRAKTRRKRYDAIDKALIEHLQELLSRHHRYY